MSNGYTLTNESVTIIYNGQTYSVQKGSPQFLPLKKALIEDDWDEIPRHLTVSKSLNAWAKGKFSINEATEVFSYDGRELPQDINERIIAMATAGEDPTPLLRFYERLQRNPSMRSVEQLYPFLKHQGIPITKDGCFLAYKGVNQNYTDAYTGKVDNSPGVVNKMPRNQISDDPRHACHEGYHVGSRGHASGYGSRMIVCKIDPEHVVCVPYDSHHEKMRVCEYKVVGNYSGQDMPNTIIEEEDIPEDVSESSDPADENDSAFNGEPEEVEEVVDIHDEEDEEEQKPKKKKSPALDIPTKYRKYAKLSTDELIALDRDQLRAFATHGLKIVGASKLPGGKTTLVAKICVMLGLKPKE